MHTNSYRPLTTHNPAHARTGGSYNIGSTAAYCTPISTSISSHSHLYILSCPLHSGHACPPPLPRRDADNILFASALQVTLRSQSLLTSPFSPQRKAVAPLACTFWHRLLDLFPTQTQLITPRHLTSSPQAHLTQQPPFLPNW